MMHSLITRIADLEKSIADTTMRNETGRESFRLISCLGRSTDPPQVRSLIHPSPRLLLGQSTTSSDPRKRLPIISTRRSERGRWPNSLSAAGGGLEKEARMQALLREGLERYAYFVQL